MIIWDEMSDSERKQSLRAMGPSGVWAADALDAKEARIRELEGALRKLAENKLSDYNCASVELAGRRVAKIAREALNAPPAKG